MAIVQNLRARLAADELDAEVAALVGRAIDTMADDDAAVGAAARDVFLTKLRVTGFRGIGQAVDVQFQPGPGLTVITGRNGCGKSSLAESMELLLTGDNARWSSKSNSDLRRGWKNLHHKGEATVSLELAATGRPMISITRTWSGDDLSAGSTVLSLPGKAAQSPDVLGWSQALATYRPFLSYGELGGLLEAGPSKLYDAIAAILGLEQFTLAKTTLSKERAEIAANAKTSKDQWASIDAALKQSTDERAAAVLVATAKRGWKPSAVEVIASAGGSGDDSTAPAWLRGLEALGVPSTDAVDNAMTALRAASARVNELAGTDAHEAHETVQLLRQALSVQAHTHTNDCPVCGTASVLDNEWEERTRRTIEALDARAAGATAARTALKDATRLAFALLPDAPMILVRAPEGIDQALAQQARDVATAWGEAVSSLRDTALDELPSMLPLTLDALRASTEQLRADGAAASAALDVDWVPLARRIIGWCANATALANDAVRAKQLQEAEDWLATAEDELREQRLAPIRTAVDAVWKDLRCDSNVALSAIDLEGKGNRRRVALGLTVDGEAAPSIGVLSQGEMHALALSMFLPRASLPESPFRFMVIDDPVQAMDPSKVDGLARRLADVAAARQVIVLTHDDRLPDAVRRLDLDARIYEVTRGAKSVVSVKSSTTPADRCLRAASDLTKDLKLPADIAGQVVAAQCRQAIEAQCIEMIQAKLIRAGRSVAQVETELRQAKTVRELLALALMNDPARGSEAMLLLDAASRSVVEACNSGAHGGKVTMAPPDLVSGARKIVKALREDAKT